MRALALALVALTHCEEISCSAKESVHVFTKKEFNRRIGREEVTMTFKDMLKGKAAAAQRHTTLSL